ncbi:uncharacterized protein LOC110984866 [Acanthaster planci]|uniref:Uncharacterized protein LOC110984866 n=1 Tax=Acanthaster planci TaxID=133434 RepID=A0A8B7Z676_ACAPL|nr:uncharacterized protein LOC110984866 [Acanthaster planci]
MLTGPLFEPETVPQTMAPNLWRPTYGSYFTYDAPPSESNKTHSCPAKLVGPMYGRYASRPPLFELDRTSRPAVPNQWMPTCGVLSLYDVPPVESNKTSCPAVLTGPLYGQHDSLRPHLFRPITMPTPTAANPMQFNSVCSVPPTQFNDTSGCLVEQMGPPHGPSGTVVPTIGLLTVIPAHQEAVDLVSLRPPNTAPPSTSDRPPIRVMLPSRPSLIIQVLCAGVGFCCTRDVIAVLSAVISAWGGMTRKIKAAFSRLKNWIVAGTKMIHWPQQSHQHYFESFSPWVISTVTKVVRSSPVEAPVTVIFPPPRWCLAKNKPKQEDEHDETNSPEDISENDISDVGETKEVLIFKVKNGSFGRIIGKKGSIVKAMRNDFNLVIMYGRLDERHYFFKLEGKSSGVKSARALCYQRVQSGLEEIQPMDIAHRVSPENIISVKYSYFPWHHGRIVGKQARCLKEIRASNVAVWVNFGEEFHHMELTGTPSNVRKAQLWIMENLNATLFANMPDLVEAPDVQLPSQAGEDQGATAEAAGPEPEAVCGVCSWNWAQASSQH